MRSDIVLVIASLAVSLGLAIPQDGTDSVRITGDETDSVRITGDESDSVRIT